VQKERVEGVKKIIAVASGKGGVGKSTISVNLALALAKNGAKVGLLDADVYGPSQPLMLNAVGEKPIVKNGRLMPVVRHGLQSMSMGYLVGEDAALVWRGPMIGKALQQLIHDTAWEGLDYLVIDLPPGTGDIQLTLCQRIPLNGAVIVTTPQDLALADVIRACEMLNTLSVPILGVVENMSIYHCSKCGHEEDIFGVGGGDKLAKKYAVDVLGRIPLDMRIREMTDNGNPTVVQDPESVHAQEFIKIANKVVGKLVAQPKDYSGLFPKVVVENNDKNQPQS
jgi:ATP-binding protein involved in chromosome partitioning